MGKKNKQGFRKTWRTLTELGQEFGLSAVKFGNLLKQHGLRDLNGEPSAMAEEGGFCEKIQPKDNKAYYLWHRVKTSEYLVSQGIEKSGLSSEEASKMTEARQLARSYMEAKKLDDEGSKFGYWMFSEMAGDIQKVGLDVFNTALKSVGYKGGEVTLEDW
jgi:hypothetical protein